MAGKVKGAPKKPDKAAKKAEEKKPGKAPKVKESKAPKPAPANKVKAAKQPAPPLKAPPAHKVKEAKTPGKKPTKAPTAPEPAGKAYINSIRMEFVLIPAGSFLMGSDKNKDKEASDWETPQHRVSLSKPFYLSKYPVTQAQWEGVMGNFPNYLYDRGISASHANSTSWDEAQEFIKRLNKKEGHSRYRLPTEAEWEYACRAGTTTRYSFGDDERKLGDYAWYDDNTGSTSPLMGQKKPNPWGLYDMHGYYEEWVQDWFDDQYYSKSPATDPRGPASGSSRVVRGGCWYCNASMCRAAYRSPAQMGFSGSIGFRLALSLE